MSENLNTENKTEANGAADTAQAKPQTVTVQPPPTDAAATSATVKIEGQEFPLDVAIASDDHLLKTALSPHYPSIKNAQISRETRAGQMIVSIVKKAEHKGFWARRLK